MLNQTCNHEWGMTHIRPGFIITEHCFKCKKISTYFSFEANPPLEEYREGEHFWNVIGSAQSIQFDLTCLKCNSVIPYPELSGLMMCTACDERCKVFDMVKELEKERTWVYVAFGFLPVDEKEQPSREKIAILETYFNKRRRSSTSRVKIISSDLVRDITTCYAEVIKDVDMLSLTPPEN